MVTFKSKQGHIKMVMSDDMAQFAIINDEARELLKIALQKIDDFEEKYCNNIIQESPPTN